MRMYNEESPLLGSRSHSPQPARDLESRNQNIHHQFCSLSGVPPSNLPKDAPYQSIPRRSLYGRAVRKRNAQNRTYLFTAALSNTLLLSQVVLGAALTGLGASDSSHILITVFGALNTIIAGVVAYLKSRGQPMRAHMFRDDLDRVVDEIENSEVMWLGIQSGVHGYDEIAIDDSVSVRSEVARLTRLYDKVVKNNTMNDPDMYLAATSDAANAALRARPPIPPSAAPAAPVVNAPAILPPPAVSETPTPVEPNASSGTAPHDPDSAPASAPPKPRTPRPTDETDPLDKVNGDSKSKASDDDLKSSTQNGAPP